MPEPRRMSAQEGAAYCSQFVMAVLAALIASVVVADFAAAQGSAQWGIAAGVSVVVGTPAPAVPDEEPLLAGGDQHGLAVEALYRFPLVGWVDAEATAVFSRITSAPYTSRGFQDEENLFPAAEIDRTFGATIGVAARAQTKSGSALVIGGIGGSHSLLEKDEMTFEEYRPFFRAGVGWEATVWSVDVRLSATFNDHIGGRGIAFIPVTAGLIF